MFILQDNSIYCLCKITGPVFDNDIHVTPPMQGFPLSPQGMVLSSEELICPLSQKDIWPQQFFQNLFIPPGETTIHGCVLLTKMPHFLGTRPKCYSYFESATVSFFCPCRIAGVFKLVATVSELANLSKSVLSVALQILPKFDDCSRLHFSLFQIGFFWAYCWRLNIFNLILWYFFHIICFQPPIFRTSL